MKNKVETRLVNNKKDNFKWICIRNNSVEQKIFDKYLLAVHKNKIVLTLEK